MLLYYFPTSYWSRVVALLLAEKGIEPERHFVDIRVNANFDPSYLAINPKGVVPTLVDGDDTVCDSVRIASHLDARGGVPLYDALGNPAVDAYVEELKDFPVMLFSYSVWVKGERGERSADILQDKVERAARFAKDNPQFRELYERKQAFFTKFRAEVYDSEHLAAETERCRAVLDRMGKELDGKTWLGGEHYSFADAIAVAMLYRLVDLGRLDHWHGDDSHGLDAYYRRLRERPSFNTVFVDDPLIP
jgi:glutathione S-transferase